MQMRDKETKETNSLLLCRISPKKRVRLSSEKIEQNVYKLCILSKAEYKKVSEYDQEKTQSQTADTEQLQLTSHREDN